MKIDMLVAWQDCPNCGRRVKTIVTDHSMPGLFNACSFCSKLKGKSLQELNEERKNRKELIK